VWIVAALFALPSALSLHLCIKYALIGGINYYKRVVLFELLVSCVLPLCVIAVSYIMTARHLVKSAQPISEGTQSPQLNACTNTAKIVLGLTAVFLISYVPCHVFWVYFLWTDHSMKSSDRHFKSSCAFIFSMCLL
jgi:ABC-type Fe3+ transport system permease subunit